MSENTWKSELRQYSAEFQSCYKFLSELSYFGMDPFLQFFKLAQSAASPQKGKSPLYECPLYDVKQSDDEALVMRNAEYPFIAIASWPTLVRSGST